MYYLLNEYVNKLSYKPHIRFDSMYINADLLIDYKYINHYCNTLHI